MAGNSKVSSRNHTSSSDDDDKTFENVDDAYEALVMKLKRQTKAFTRLRKYYRSTNNQIACFNIELREMTIKVTEMERCGQ